MVGLGSKPNLRMKAFADATRQTAARIFPGDPSIAVTIDAAVGAGGAIAQGLGFRGLQAGSTASSKDDLTIERLGGLAGFGLPGGRLRSRSRHSIAGLSDEERSRVGCPVCRGAMPSEESTAVHRFDYRLTRLTGQRAGIGLSCPRIGYRPACWVAFTTKSIEWRGA